MKKLAEIKENLPINFDHSMCINTVTLKRAMAECPICEVHGKQLNDGYDSWECPKCNKEWQFGKQYILVED